MQKKLKNLQNFCQNLSKLVGFMQKLWKKEFFLEKMRFLDEPETHMSLILNHSYAPGATEH